MRITLLLALLSLTPVGSTSAQTFIPLPAAGNSATATDINQRGQIVGWFQDAVDFRTRSFIATTRGDVAVFDVPGATHTDAQGVNSRGEIVGRYYIGSTCHGFLLSRGRIVTIDYPGASCTVLTDINARGDIVGYYFDGEAQRGFLLRDGVFTPISVDGLPVTVPESIDNAGTIAGYFGEPIDSPKRGFVLEHGMLTRVDYPGAESTILTGGNAAGTLVGSFAGQDGLVHGFVLDRGQFVDLGANLIARGINESGTIVGSGDQGAFFMRRRKR